MPGGFFYFSRMKIVFLGTPDFAVASLAALLDAGFTISGVVTAPDRPAGRGRAVQESAVKQFMKSRQIPVLQPVNLKSERFHEELRALKADLQVVVAFRMLPEAVWNMPPLGTYNLHASLLPAYRGAAPINRAIMEGATETGVTVFRLRHQVDTGSILMQEKCTIGENTTAGELHDTLRDQGARLLARAVEQIDENFRTGKPLVFQEQNDTLATHAPKIFREDCEINWAGTASDLHNQVRGLSPSPGAFTWLHNGDAQPLQLKVLRSLPVNGASSGVPGQVVTDGQSFLHVVCGTGALALLDVQLQGKKRMNTGDFLRGYRLVARARCSVTS